MALQTLVTADDVKTAGNLSSRASNATILFYVEIASLIFREMIGTTVYANAIAGTLEADVLLRLKKSETLMTIAFALPAIGMVAGEQGVLSALSLGTGGQMEVMSYAKEITELAGAFMNLAIRVASGYLITEMYQQVWHHVILRMFPSLDEMPTVATIASEDEMLLKYYRGDEAYKPEHDDAVS